LRDEIVATALLLADSHEKDSVDGVAVLRIAPVPPICV
jgi:hypothetical protein